MKNKTLIAELKGTASSLKNFADLHLSNELNDMAWHLNILAKSLEKPKTWNQSVASLKKLMK